MRIGSTSKHFASLLALILAEEGALDIDAPAGASVPGLKPLQGVPSLRQFINHTSGYRCAVDLLLLASGLAVHPVGTSSPPRPSSKPWARPTPAAGTS
jgi:CubicO group peptidase (beta-lactamase class C family)